MPDLRDLYEEVILDHNRNPRNYPKNPPGSNRHASGHNPLCGDEIGIHLIVEDGLVKDVGFEGEGCAISVASASMMTQAIIGMTEGEVHILFQKVHEMLTENKKDDLPDIGKLRALAGVHEYPSRVKCASLAWHTLVAALENKEGETVTTE
jgi:nitrogen fixation NifU-like protein